MEEYVKGDTGEELWTFCDNCNSADSQELSLEEGVFRGPASEALENGWTETDFGHLCLSCSIAEAKLQEMGETSVPLESALAMLDPSNPILKTVRLDWGSEAEKTDAFTQMAVAPVDRKPPPD